MPKIVISASRRTDIPAFYMPWFMEQIHRGFFERVHPYTQQISHLQADAGHVHTIVFWSKNFGPFLEGGYGQQLNRMGYRLFFNFTINSPHPLLEPGVPPLAERLEQLGRLAVQFGPAAIQWRLDPICFFQGASGQREDNLDHFSVIARQAAQAGVSICITSFVDLYAKVRRRATGLNLRWIDPPVEEKIAQLVRMARHLSALGIQLQLCCEKELLEALPPEAGVQGAACIPNQRLAALYGPGISLAKDAGQRAAAGCGCRVSRDIGNYRLHPCKHNCLFCYANPHMDQKR
jgi:hypothetical protein